MLQKSLPFLGNKSLHAYSQGEKQQKLKANNGKSEVDNGSSTFRDTPRTLTFCQQRLVLLMNVLHADRSVHSNASHNGNISLPFLQGHPQAMPPALQCGAEHLLLGRAVSLEHCPLSSTSLHPWSLAQLGSEAQSEDSLALPPTRLPADVPGAPELTAPKRQQGLSWGTHALRRAEGIADCPSRTGS